MFCCRHSALAAANFTLQAYCGLQLACAIIEPLWQDVYENEVMGAAELCALLETCRLPAIWFNTPPYLSHAIIVEAFEQRHLTLVQMRRNAAPEDQRWGIITDYDGRFLQWAECTGQHDLPQGPTRWDVYATGQVVIVELELPDAPVVSVRIEGTLPYSPN